MGNPTFQEILQEGEKMSAAEKEALKQQLDKTLVPDLEADRQAAEKTAKETDRRDRSSVRPFTKLPRH